MHCVVDAFDQSAHKSSFRANDEPEVPLGDAAPSDAERPSLLVFSANDEASLRGWVSKLSDHLESPDVSVQLPDLAYTLSERRSRLFHRGYLLTKTIREGLDTDSLVVGKPGIEPPRVSCDDSIAHTIHVLTRDSLRLDWFRFYWPR